MIKQMLLMLFVFALMASCAPTKKAYIYKNKTTGELLYCENDQGDDLKDFTFVAEASIDDNLDIRLCELENN